MHNMLFLMSTAIAAFMGPRDALTPWSADTHPTDVARSHVEQITAGQHKYAVIQSGTMDGRNCRSPMGCGMSKEGAFLQTWESNRSVRMENVGQTDIVNPWLSNGRNNFRNVDEIVFQWAPPGDPDGDAIADYHFELSNRADMKWPLSMSFYKLISRTSDVVKEKDPATNRVIKVTVRADGRLVNRFAGDGIVVATPTGSTAYSLAAGGPVVYPTIAAMLLTPLSPHALAARPLILPPDTTLELEVEAGADDATVNLDGQRRWRVKPGRPVRIGRAEFCIRLVVPNNKTYYQILRDKMKWSGSQI